jgi:ankyrin repeat protein
MTTNNFETAVDAIVNGNIGTLQSLLQQQPELIRMRSTKPHQAMLMHYIGANGVEEERQKTPVNAVNVLQLLLQAGAEVDAVAMMYGGATTLGLVATSCHPEAAGMTKPLLTVLLQAGADINFSYAGGNNQTALIGALHNYQPEAAFFLAEQGAALDLESACAIGRLDLVKDLLHTDSAEKLYTGFNWDCLYGQLEVVDYLIEQGIDVNRQAVGFCGLQMATFGAHHDIMRLLLANNASIDVLNEYGGNAINNAIWLVANRRHATLWPKRPVDDLISFELLLAAGARAEPEALTWLEQQHEADPSLKERVLTLLRNS